MKKIKKRKLFSLIAILLIVVMTFGLLYTNAKYTSTDGGRATASVAKYVFNVTGSDSYGGTDIKALKLAQSVDPKTLVNGKIAPGTEGAFDVVVNATGSEVGIYYDVSFANTSEHDLPTNLKLTLDGENWNFDEKITGTIDANATDKTVTRTVEWSWAYETKDNTGSTTAGNIADTIDGKNAFDYSFTVTATGVQVNPLTGTAPTIHTHKYNNLIGKTIVDNKVYCGDDCEGIEVTVVTEGKTVEINGVIYNVSDNVITSKYEEPTHEHNYDNLIGKTIVNNKVYCSDDCDGIDVTTIVSGKTVQINGVVYDITNNVIQGEHTTHTYEGATLIQDGTSYKVACTECGKEITGITYEGNGEVTIDGNTYSVTEDTKVIGSKKASYVVKHWQQNVEGIASSHNSTNYTLKDTQNLKGVIGESITPITKTYVGFSSPSTLSTTIKADGTTEVNYYYVRNSYTVTLNKGTGIDSTSITGEVSGTNKSTYLYGETITIGADVSVGYTWLNWTGTHKASTQSYTFEMPGSNVTDTANATPNTNTIYTVNYWQQNTDGIAENHDSDNYTKYETKTYTGTTGSTVTATLNDYDGFITPEEQSITILGNGSAVIDYYYERENTIDPAAFITEWNLTQDNTTITLPITETPNITVDWGDGTVEKIASIKPSHTYTSLGTYDIKISGALPTWNFYTVNNSKEYIIAVKQWGNVGFTTMEKAFNDCNNLVSIPLDSIPKIDNASIGGDYITSPDDVFLGTFSGCSSLTSIPENLFANCSNVNAFIQTFAKCSSLTSIPENLFANCSNAFNFMQTFAYCSNLTSIPENLFKDCSSAVSLDDTFGNCSSLTSIPENLFANCPILSNLSKCFAGCSSLTSIPENLFANCSRIGSFYYTFAYCNNLTSIPENLFANCSSVNDMSYTFMDCKSLRRVPIKLATDCPNVKDWSTTFTGCPPIEYY